MRPIVNEPAGRAPRLRAPAAVITAALIAHTRAYREALVAAFESDGRVAISPGVAHTEDAVAAAARGLHLGVVLLQLPLAQGFAAARLLTSAGHDHGIRVVAFGVGDAEERLAWRAAGVSECIPQDASLDDLIGAVVDAAKRETAWSPPTPQTLAERVRALTDPGLFSRSAELSKLTEREREILRLVGIGLTNRQIAKELIVEVSTIKNHVHSIFVKLGIHHRSDVSEWLSRPILDRGS